MRKFLEWLWAELEMNGKQLYNQQKNKSFFPSISMKYKLINYDKGVTMILSEKYHYDSQNNSQN